ncbi:single-stranded DNA-binding protein [Candidatus Wolfebacteria bacterium CG03_land_8_20_14_0_80_40_12]|uniref:Single-stranded DNA-binding protein n=1 Tax=Candidatus Wolfebacteria bacterium CG03_land_8_20_14_0_80_40_12 TaxID=1975069 RepID=A0A2M7B689_9BACT|nr:MAG: single-stranded DNA-binding protein [Candidatus Wolfebacteria bacterium CG03_land_8_20_14_0_80_40_12]
MNLNKVFVLGRLTADPQVKTTSTGQQVANFGVATNRIWNDKSGNRQQEVEYHNIVVWGRQAEIVGQFLLKGSLILIEGRIRTRTWQNQQGQSQKTTEIIGERIQLGPRPTSIEKEFTKKPPEAVKQELPEIDIEEEVKAEDLPF